MRLFSGLFGAALLLALAGCDWAELTAPLPSMKDLSELNLTVLKNQKQPAWQSPLLQKHHLVGRIWRPADGRFVTEETLVAALVRSAFILLGEKHDNPDHHLLQARLIRELSNQGRRPAVVWEMIPEAKQAVLDQFHATYSRDAAALGAALGWNISGWPDWEMYQPVAAAAMADNLAMYGAGLTKSLVRALAKGRPSFEFSKRRRVLGLHKPMPETLRARSIEQLYKGHCELMERTALGPLFNVQRARDAVFAEHMLTSGAADGTILIAGDGHVRHDIAVPLFLKSHQPGVKVTAVAFVEVVDGVLDPVEYAEFFSAPVLPFDYVWFTPRADAKDHCAQLRKKWGKPPKPLKLERTPETPARMSKKVVPKTAVKPAPKAAPESEAKKPAEPIPNMPKMAEPEVRDPVEEVKIIEPEENKPAEAMTDESKDPEEQSSKTETPPDTPTGPPIPRSKPPRP